MLRFAVIAKVARKHQQRSISRSSGWVVEKPEEKNKSPTEEENKGAAGEPSGSDAGKYHTSATGIPKDILEHKNTEQPLSEPKVEKELEPKYHEHLTDEGAALHLREQIAGIFADSAHEDAGKGKVKTTERGLENPTKYGDWEYNGQASDFD